MLTTQCLAGDLHQKVVLTGSAGIGKTTSIGYMLWEIATTQHPEAVVILQADNKPYVMKLCRCARDQASVGDAVPLCSESYRR